MSRSIGSFLMLSLVGMCELTASAGAEDFIHDGRIPATEIQAVHAVNDTLYAAAGGKLYFRSLASDAWDSTGQFHDPADAVFDLVKHGNRLFAATVADYVYESSDGGNSWTRRSTGLTGLGANVVLSLATRGDYLYAGTSGAGIFRMPMSGPATWSPFRDDLPSSYAWEVMSLCNAHDRLIAGAGINATVYHNDPGSSQWTEWAFAPFIPSGLGMQSMVACGDTVYGAAHDGLYTSLDTGKTWVQYLPNLGLLPEASLTVTARNEVYAIVSRIESYLYRATGTNWQFIQSFPGRVVYDVAAFGNRLYVGCPDGLWYLPLSPTGGDDPDPNLPSGYDLSQNYPNPFNPSTRIDFALPRNSHARIEVIDLLGRRVATLVDKQLSAGTHTIEWDGRTTGGSKAASGVYFYKLTTDAFANARRMVLVK